MWPMWLSYIKLCTCSSITILILVIYDTVEMKMDFKCHYGIPVSNITDSQNPNIIHGLEIYGHK